MSWKVITSLLDIFIIAFIIYYLLNIISGTRAVQLIKGLGLIFVVALVAQLLQLNTVNWFLDSFLTIIMVALPIVFQPELRRALEQIGRGGFLKEQFWQNWGPKEINEIVLAVSEMSEQKIGALIVISRRVGLKNYIETGIMLNSEISKQLLYSVFQHESPLHDGALIIENGRIRAASCFLNLSTRSDINPRLGTRHRAAIGITEESDALALVVSEETGVISFAEDGQLSRHLDKTELREKLSQSFGKSREKSFVRRHL
ncbi:diadenylate cyclase [Halanaerobium congolense]|uniref:Diadenylate cyclase n=1 Tax=Halanaerobium congolense TaxID=54121 RepID=A0A1G6Q237_9FIRM|nr:diadenylate cyclase CdaA [Halanaerobium congolense]OEG62107.1 MAG: TIGR00159 family protein [Halanaerobium sp. MDAL1]PTX15521.1 diadenylate cyclase [Halanaerobium congolense]PXV63883.1 diadenylate cyclase [Halanaerobium congolense]TDP21652.1 diadenylate cyclase [Halanaerobium congolense]TDS31609.1 diadenylate cyclase [Halanaerobium congolense]